MPGQSKLMKAFGAGLLVLAGILLSLPVLGLPVFTAVPRWVWLLLLGADLGVFITGFRLRQPGLRVAVVLGGGLLVCLAAVAASQYFAATPPIRAANGDLYPNSIASLEKVTLNGTEQWITLRGQDVNKPVLLYLGMGGPGGGGFATRSLFQPLEDDFVVVAWDEPGTGKSYDALSIGDLTSERFIEDARALTLMLRERFQEDKIYVYGVSWTSILGIWLVQEYPELYHAYIGNGQMVNTTENDVMGYNLALKVLEEQGETRRLEKLERNGPPPYSGEGLAGKYVAYLDVLNEYMGEPPLSVIVPIVPFFAPEYGYVDKINHTRGLIESFTAVYPQLRDLEFREQARRLEVPVYLFAGRNDVNAMSSLAESYFEMLEAPHKEMIWLEGGHGLESSNLPQFEEVMVNTVLAQTYPPGED